MSNVHDNEKRVTFEVGEYIVNRNSIGRGASGTIYKGYHKRTKQEVAIKEIHETNLNDIKRNIKTEIKLMKRLKHPNIVELYDVILDYKVNNIYLIIEYCPEGDFYKFQKKKPIQEIHVQKYMKQLMLGLKYLNEKDIMHRDLKPQNILIAKDGSLKLTDFGYAKVVNPNNMVKTFCGSPLYMAPEIIKSKGNNDYTIKSDLWSVGCIFYEMLTGFPPFHVHTMSDLIRKLDEEDIIIPKFLNLSVESKDLLFSLLQSEPEKRISWDDFFNHKWFQKDLLAEEENKLLAFDIDSHGFTTDLPSISQYKRNTKIFVSRHLTESETERFRSKDRSDSYNSNPSVPDRSSGDYVVVGTPPERAREKEKLKQMTKIIEEKVESNMIDNRNINDIYEEYSNREKDNEDKSDNEDMFYSCNSENGKEIIDAIDDAINQAESEPIPIPSFQNRLKDEWLFDKEKHSKTKDDIISENFDIHSSANKHSFNFNELFESNSTHEGSDKRNVMEFSTYQSNYFGKKSEDNKDKYDDTDDLEFSTSLISTEQSLIVENTDAYVIIDHNPKDKPIMRSDQHEYRKTKTKVKKLLKSSLGFFKGSLDYIGSYGQSSM